MNLYVAICLLALTASAKADGALGLGGLGGLVYAPGHASADYYAYPRYAFEYSVKDPHTGDNKAQWEKRDGDVVKGAYSLVEPDGSLRVVEYYADDKSGFNAVVKRLGPNLHPTTVHAAPIYKAPIPILGHGPVVSPISIGPVAHLGHLASAPLISGPVHGPALSTQNLIKDTVPILKPILPVPIHHEPILPVPIVKAPIVPAPILHEPILKGPILPGPTYNSGPYLPGPILPGPIYKAGPIYPESSLGPLPIYKAPLPLYNKLPLIKGSLLPYPEIPLIKEPLPLYKDVPLYKEPLSLYKDVPLYKEPLTPYKDVSLYKEPLPLYKDLPLFKEQIPYYNREPIPPYKEHVPLIRGPLPALPLLKGPVELGPAEGLGLHGKGIDPWVGNRPITSLDWESLGKGPIGRPYGNDGEFFNGHIGPVYDGYLEKGLLNNQGYRH